VDMWEGRQAMRIPWTCHVSTLVLGLTIAAIMPGCAAPEVSSQNREVSSQKRIERRGKPSPEPELSGLSPCPAPDVARTGDWTEVALAAERGTRAGFTFALPACFQLDPEPPRYVHGGKRWRCERATVEVVWGMWGQQSFPLSYARCATTIGGRPAMVATGEREGGVALIVWYPTEALDDPILSAWSPDRGDEALLRATVYSGQVQPVTK
jgi:hypothetical protein